MFSMVTPHPLAPSPTTREKTIRRGARRCAQCSAPPLPWDGSGGRGKRVTNELCLVVPLTQTQAKYDTMKRVIVQCNEAIE
jgi:hypothetical protein